MLRILYQFPDWLRRLTYKDAFWRGNTGEKVVYLTFDDGPVPEVTPRVLDILDEMGVKATFFWVGENLTKYPNLAAEVLRRGHYAGNHTYHHISGWQAPAIAYQSEILLTEQKMQEVRRLAGITEVQPKLFRPPYGRSGLRMHRWLKEQGYKVVLWDIVSHDYNRRYSPERIVKIVMRYVRPGSVLLMHDSLKSDYNIITALPLIIRRLQLAGYEFHLISSSAAE